MGFTVGVLHHRDNGRIVTDLVATEAPLRGADGCGHRVSPYFGSRARGKLVLLAD